ncbi:MAG: hypothetical protein IT514_13595 [Burkholderiales bacterium]|nr:hypothetical protein [Burkholderiales bacterium]
MTHAAKARIYLAAIAVLLLVIAAMAYKFIVAGSTQEGQDGRVAIVLEPGERALMLREMREFVAGLQLVAEALAREDMPGVAGASRAMGTPKTHDVPAALMGKLPLAFKTLASATHRGFDAIAADAQANGTSRHALAQLGEVLKNCVACHASYQVVTAGAAPGRR